MRTVADNTRPARMCRGAARRGCASATEALNEALETIVRAAEPRQRRLSEMGIEAFADRAANELLATGERAPNALRSARTVFK